MAKTKQQVIDRAKKRIEAINYSAKRILIKINDLPDDSRQKAWKKRLAEYTVSLEHLNIELKYGRPFPINGAPTEGGVSIEVPAGEIKMECK